jgi:hypothetical protein
MGTLDADEVTIASSAAIATAKKDSDAGREREKSQRDFIRQLESVNEFLKRLDTMIAQAELQLTLLIEKQAQALMQAEYSFDRMHEAEDLLADIQDGISPEEKRRLIEMLGVDPETLTVEELTILLQQEMRTSHEAGLEHTEQAELLEKKIQAKQDVINSLKGKREAYVNAETPEEKQAIEREFSSSALDNEGDFHKEVSFSSAPLPP